MRGWSIVFLFTILFNFHTYISFLDFVCRCVEVTRDTPPIYLSLNNLCPRFYSQGFTSHHCASFKKINILESMNYDMSRWHTSWSTLYLHSAFVSGRIDIPIFIKIHVHIVQNSSVSMTKWICRVVTDKVYYYVTKDKTSNCFEKI